MEEIALQMMLKAAEDFLNAARKLGTEESITCRVIDGGVMVYNSTDAAPRIDYYKPIGKDWERSI